MKETGLPMCSVVFGSFLPFGCIPPAPLSMGFPRQEHWSGLPFPTGDLPNPGIEPASPVSPALRADSLLLSHWGRERETETLQTETTNSYAGRGDEQSVGA